MISFPTPTKPAILSAIAEGMNVHEQARHFGISLWELEKLRRKYGLLGVRRKQRPTVKKERLNHNRLNPVVFPASDAYVKGVERDLHAIHRITAPGISFPAFREALRTPSGQRLLGAWQKGRAA